MYLRPRGIFEKFLVERKITMVSPTGRPTVEFEPTKEVIFGVIASADISEQERWKQYQHTITHTIIQRLGNPKARVGDMLVNGTRNFLVQGVDNPVGLGQFIIYYVNERNDKV